MQRLFFGLALSVGLWAQNLVPTSAQDTTLTLQQLGVNLRPAISREAFAQLVTGSPFSAREERKTVQTLGDGTQLESSDTSTVYRDAQGRTRMEQTTQGKTRVTISDPVAGVRLQLDPEQRTALRIALPGGGGGRGRGVTAAGAGELLWQTIPGHEGAVQTENLGQSMQNGVMAQGTRVTLTIPHGQIGNNRDIHVVSERWYSKDLQMAVKTMNSDPRFGVTTWELTNISRSAPDPMLFQAPADYTITAPGGRGHGGR